MANDLNSVNLIGRLVREPEMKVTTGGTSVLRFSLAVSERRKSGDQWVDEVSYFDIVIWGKTAESLQSYLHKGTQVAIKGRLKQERWKDQTNQTKSRIEIVAESVQLLGGNNQQTSGTPAPTPAQHSTPAPAPEDYGDSDIPF